MSLLVDLVIAVHDPRRPVLRALDSIVSSSREDVRVTVVCHGIAPNDVPGLCARESTQVRLVGFADDIPSPAGPFNRGLDLATAKYVGVMGSDDFLNPGALDAWIAQAEGKELDIVFAGLTQQGGPTLRNPPVRPWRRNHLSPYKDRLFARAAPLGLIRRDTLESPRIRFAEGFRTGEDIPFTTELICRARRIGVAFDAPRYVIGRDAEARVTAEPHPIETVLAPVLRVLESNWLSSFPLPVRTAAVTARVRANLVADVVTRHHPADWSLAGLARIRQALELGLREAPHALAPLPAADQDLLETLREEECTVERAMGAVTAWSQAGRRARMLPRKLSYALHRESTLVRYVGYALARLGA